MKSYIFSLLLIVLPSALLAVTETDFNKKWAHSLLVKNTMGKSTNETKIFKRFVWEKNIPIAVAESVATIVRGTQEKTNLEDLAQKIDRSFGGNMEIKRAVDKLELHGPFEKLNRMITVTLQKKGENFLIITTFTRLGFYPSLKKDIAGLHKMASSYFIDTTRNKTTVRIWESFSNFILSSAHAESLPGVFPTSNSATGPQMPPIVVQVDTGAAVLSTAVNTQGENATAAINNLSSTVQTQGNNVSGAINTQGSNVVGALSAQGGQLTNTISTQGTQLTNAITTQGDQLSRTIGDQGDSLNQNMRDLNTTVQNQGGSLNANLGSLNVSASKANDNWAQSNKLLAQAMDPNHMAKIAFYSAAGAALGAFTINLAIQGVSSGIGFLLELFTHNKQKKLEWDDFQKAMETWDTQLNDLMQMEKIVDNFIGAFEFFKNKNLGTNYPQILTTAVHGMNMDRELFMEKFRDQSLEKSCREVYFNSASELEDKVGEYKKLLDLAGSNSMLTESPESYFCGQLAELRRKLLSAEQTMQNLRLKILLAENQYYGKQKDAQVAADKTADSIEDRMGQSERKQLERKKQIEEDLATKREKEKRDWIKQCYRGKVAPGEALILDESLSRHDRKLLCASAFTSSSDIKTEDTQNDELAIRTDLSILRNDFINIHLAQQQQRWFTKIHMDAYCYQFAHRPESEMPKKCKDFPETLYSLGLTRAYNKADAAYQGSCAQRYADGVGAIARDSKPASER